MGIIDFIPLLGAHDWSYAYAVAEFDAGAGGPATLVCGSDDGIQVWIDGQQVHRHEVTRGCGSMDDRVVVTLRPGRNRVVVKVDNYTMGWAFALGFRLGA